MRLLDLKCRFSTLTTQSAPHVALFTHSHLLAQAAMQSTQLLKYSHTDEHQEEFGIQFHVQGHLIQGRP